MSNNQRHDFFDKLQFFTEVALTYRKRSKRLKREKQAKKNWIIDWIEAFLWAAGVVLLINQYLFQAYQIPSGSMIDTLLIGDHIFVNKLVYGPELLPGLGKIHSPFKPERNDVIIFESPSYISHGTAFDIAQRIIYMLTLSIVDIDKDEKGRPKAHFLIKRAVGMGGDRVFNRNGNMYFKFAGEDRIVSEQDYNIQRGWKHNVRRLAGETAYDALRYSIQLELWQMASINMNEANNRIMPDFPVHIEGDTWETMRLAADRTVNPHEERFRRRYYRKKLGWYVPPGRVLPLGDNRDNSTDGRWFGPVHESKILGQGLFIYWPGRSSEDGGRYSPPLDPPPLKTGPERIGIIR
ncbi:MAG: signal peptidase I [Termitinemataceae bacterium]|nr:MAG: signal peptidase I [Termitinemataceae bacterium]